MARVPEKRATVGATAWLAPYLGLVRNAPLVLSHAPSAALAEAEVNRLIAPRELRPRTITILADYDSLGDNVVEIDPGMPPPPGPLTPAQAEAAAQTKAKYRLNTEPFIPTGVGAMADFGVGRIPLQSLADASVLFARGLVRQRLAAGRPVRLLMVANSGRRALPLCETISRLTAEEYKNCGVGVDDFYGKLDDSPAVLAAAKTAGLIIYEGHLAYQDLFDVPSAHRDTAPDSYFEEELDNLEESGPRPPPVVQPTTPLRVPAAGGPVRGQCHHHQRPDGGAAGGHFAELRLVGRAGLVADRRAGRRGPGGQRDADPQRLGQRAGQGAERRGALSRGDLGRSAARRPELLVLPGRLEDPPRPAGTAQEPARGPQLPAVGRSGVARAAGGRSAAGESAAGHPLHRADELVIDVPRQRLPEARNDKYYARMFPGSQPAGMVKPPRGDSARRVTPVYFFRLPLPEDFAAEGTLLAGRSEKANQATYRVDPAGRFLYVLFFPELEKPGQRSSCGGARAPPPRLGRASP